MSFIVGGWCIASRSRDLFSVSLFECIQSKFLRDRMTHKKKEISTISIERSRIVNSKGKLCLGFSCSTKTKIESDEGNETLNLYQAMNKLCVQNKTHTETTSIAHKTILIYTHAYRICIVCSVLEYTMCEMMSESGGGGNVHMTLL